MYSLTNFFNNVFEPDKDFPAVTSAGSIWTLQVGFALPQSARKHCLAGMSEFMPFAQP